ncbi:hypothetical protein GCM10009731_50180 [Streptomyces globosus]
MVLGLAAVVEDQVAGLDEVKGAEQGVGHGCLLTAVHGFGLWSTATADQQDNYNTLESSSVSSSPFNLGELAAARLPPAA